MNDFRCFNCKKLLGKIEGKAEIICPRCKTLNTVSYFSKVHDHREYPTSEEKI